MADSVWVVQTKFEVIQQRADPAIEKTALFSSREKAVEYLADYIKTCGCNVSITIENLRKEVGEKEDAQWHTYGYGTNLCRARIGRKHLARYCVMEEPANSEQLNEVACMKFMKAKAEPLKLTSPGKQV
jgi:hypothetical protein